MHANTKALSYNKVNESTKLKYKRSTANGNNSNTMSDSKQSNIIPNHHHATSSSNRSNKRSRKGSKHHAHHHHHQSRHSLLGMLRSPSLFPSRRLARWILRVLKVAAALNLFRAIPFFVLEIYYLMALVLLTAFALFSGYQGTHPVPKIRPLIIYSIGSTMSAMGDLSILVVNRGKWTTSVPEVSTFQEACWDAYIILVCAVVVTDLLGTVLALALARSVWQTRQWDAKAVAQWLAEHQHHSHSSATRHSQGVATKMRMIYNPGLLADIVKQERVAILKQRALERRLEAERSAAHSGTPRKESADDMESDAATTPSENGDDTSHPLARPGAPRVTIVTKVDVVPTEEKSLIPHDSNGSNGDHHMDHDDVPTSLSLDATSSISSNGSFAGVSPLLISGRRIDSSDSNISISSMGSGSDIDGKSPTSGDESPTSPRSDDSPISMRTPKLDKARDTDMAHFHDNSVHKARYNPLTFLPLFLYAQFSRLANLYTLCIVIFSAFDFSPIGPLSSITPLMFVLTTSAIKELLEDWKRRKADNEINARPAHVLSRDGDEAEFKESSWAHVKVGDVVRVKKGEVLPADLIFLSSASEVGICYIETSNLDGETDLKIRTCLTDTCGIRSAEQAGRLRFLIECEQPNNNLYNFDGRITIQTAGDATEKTVPVPLSAILLRGTQLRTTAYIYGIVINTGVDTKVEQNSTQSRNKRSAIEKNVNNMLMLLFLLQMVICFLCSLGHNGWRMKPEPGYPEPWYIQNIDERQYIFMSYIIIYNTMIPLSLYVSMELSRAVNGRHINQDKLMYDPVSKVQSQARNTNIVEELGAIKYVFTDKTGTLTCNQMVFVQCSIAGIRYGHDEASRRKYSAAESRPPATAASFHDPALLDRLHNGHATAETIHDFLLVLSLCNTVQPEWVNDAGAWHGVDDDAPSRSRTNSLSSQHAEAVAAAVATSKATLDEVAIAIEGKTASIAAAAAAAAASPNADTSDTSDTPTPSSTSSASTAARTPPYSARPPAVPYPYSNTLTDSPSNGNDVHATSLSSTPSTAATDSPAGSDITSPSPVSPFVGSLASSITITSADGETKSLSSLRAESKRSSDGHDNGNGSGDEHDPNDDHHDTSDAPKTKGYGSTATGDAVGDDQKITYQADSPDEHAMVTTARSLGFQLRSRIGRRLVLRVDGVDESYEVLNSLAFTSKRKRMSVIIRRPDGRIQLLCKGADEVIGPRLREADKEKWEATQDHLTDYAEDGLRTMVSAGTFIDEPTYDDWNKRYHAATVNLNVEQGKADIDALCEEIEANLSLLGATAVEDKLQEGVPETIEALRRGGIKVWTLTGDKQETAMSVGAMSRVLTEDMEVLVLQENMTEEELSAALDRIILDHHLRLSPGFIEKKTGRKRQAKPTISGMGMPGSPALAGLGSTTVPPLLATSSGPAEISIRVSPERERSIGGRRSSYGGAASMERSSSYGGSGMERSASTGYESRGYRNELLASPAPSPRSDGMEGESKTQAVLPPHGSSPASSKPRSKQQRKLLDPLSPSPRMGPNTTLVTPPSPMALSRAAAPILPPLSSLDVPPPALGSLRGIRSPSLGDRHGSDVPQRPLALVCSGMTLATALPQSVTGDEDDLDDLSIKFFAVAKACVSVICYRCTPMQKSTAVRTVSERSVLWGDGAITLAIGDGANDVPMLLQAHVGVGMSGNEGMQAVLSSDFSIPRFHMLQRLLMVHGYRSNKRMSILILYSVYKNLGLCLPQFWFSFWSGFSGQLLYFDFLFTMFNSLFTALPILAVTMFDTDASDDTLTKNHKGHALYATAGNRNSKVSEFVRWLAMGFWMSFVVFIVPFASLSDIPSDDGQTIGMWGEGLACYTYLIVACQLQVALHTKQWTKSNIIAMTVSSVSYIIFVLVLTTFTLTEFGLVWMQQAAYGVLRELLSLPAFWLGLILAPTMALLPGFVYEASVQLFAPPLAYQLALVEREKKQRDAAAAVAGIDASGMTSSSSIATSASGATHTSSSTTNRRPLAYARLE